MASPTATLSVREQNKLRIRTAILKAATESFALKGVSETTIEQIAQGAGIARATVFKYFPSKHDIVAEIVQQMDREFIRQIDSHAVRPVGAAERIVDLFRENGRRLEARREVLRPLVAILEQGWGETVGELRAAQLKEAFARLAAGPERRPDAEILAEILLGTYFVIAHNWRMRDDYDVARHMEAAAHIIARGL